MMENSIEADLVLLNGKVITVDPRDTIAEAVAVFGNKILKVGSTKEIKPLIGKNTKKIDLKSRILVPGFIDAHMHLVRALDPRVVQIRCPPIKSVKEILQAIKKKAEESPKGGWIIGACSYSPDHYVVEKRYVTRWELDEVAPNNPVILRQHTSVANSKALELAGITKDTPDPPGGRILKDQETGEPDGRLIEKARTPVENLIPPPELEWLKEGTIKYGQWMVEHGITTVHSFHITSPDQFRALQQLKVEGRLPLRVLFTFRMLENALKKLSHFAYTLKMFTDLGLENNFGDDWLKLTGIKLFVDGGMTGKNAKVYEHYVDEPDNFGLTYPSQDELNRTILEVQKAGLRSLVHAIGDEGLDMLIKAFEYTLAKTGEKDLTVHRHRIEHGGNNWNNPERLKKIKKLGIILATNPQFIWRIGDAYNSYLGAERMKDAFRFKTIRNMGIKMTAGADAAYPPLEGIECCVTHKSMEGTVFTPDEKLTPLEAIRLFTMDNAYGGFEESLKGSIEVGKLADMVVLADDPTAVPAETIKDIKVDMTIIDGKIAYTRKS